MSSNKGRSIFTLGDPPRTSAVSKLKERKKSDPFAKDPFKIQSFNFHYAERPQFPMTTMKPKTSETDQKSCDSFYYNQNFAKSSNDVRRSHNLEKPLSNLAKFHQYRRRKYLQNYSAQSQSSLRSEQTDVLASRDAFFYGRPASSYSQILARPSSNVQTSLLKRSNTDYFRQGESRYGFESKTSPSLANDSLRVQISIDHLKQGNSLNTRRRSLPENILAAKKSSFHIPTEHEKRAREAMTNYEKKKKLAVSSNCSGSFCNQTSLRNGPSTCWSNTNAHYTTKVSDLRTHALSMQGRSKTQTSLGHGTLNFQESQAAKTQGLPMLGTLGRSNTFSLKNGSSTSKTNDTISITKKASQASNFKTNLLTKPETLGWYDNQSSLKNGTFLTKSNPITHLESFKTQSNLNATNDSQSSKLKTHMLSKAATLESTNTPSTLKNGPSSWWITKTTPLIQPQPSFGNFEAHALPKPETLENLKTLSTLKNDPLTNWTTESNPITHVQSPSSNLQTLALSKPQTLTSSYTQTLLNNGPSTIWTSKSNPITHVQSPSSKFQTLALSKPQTLTRSNTQTLLKNGPSTSSICSKKKRSGCEININIKSLDDDAISDNVTIQIQKEPSINDLNSPHKNPSRHSKMSSNIKLNINSSTKSLEIKRKLSNENNMDEKGLFSQNFSPTKGTTISGNKERKKLCSLTSSNVFLGKTSNYNFHQRDSLESNCNWKDIRRERLNTLNSIYAPTQSIAAVKKKSPRPIKTSKDKLPSFLTWSEGNNLQAKQRSTNERLSPTTTNSAPTPVGKDLRTSPSYSTENTSSSPPNGSWF
uniref:Uncharacterized protein n=1 Tax=Stomoxys calcitrans TaxID=35570 RepID=A0A1I8PES3_STOCA